jgi:hypothetical protein
MMTSPPQIVRHQCPAIELCFDFDADLDFPNLAPPAKQPVTPRQLASPNQSMKSASSSITMSEIHAIRTEMHTKFDADLKIFKQKMIEKLENDIADTVQKSVATALAGINANIHSSLQANNVLVYTTMKAERTEITEAMVSAVTSKVDIAVSTAIARALSDFTPSNADSLPNPRSENVDMSDVGKEV